MSEAVVIGAGCVGRGFVAHLFSSAGWHVTFLDTDAPLVAALARDVSYVHVTVSTNQSVRTVVGPVTALDNGRDPDAAVAALVSADVAATATRQCRSRTSASASCMCTTWAMRSLPTLGTRGRRVHP